MIEALDNTLYHLLAAEVSALRPGGATLDPAQIRFQPPDADWRNHVETTLAAKPALNIYLTDLRENRVLRSNERVPSISSGMVVQEPSPDRIDCHYVVSAWSGADEDTADVDDVGMGRTGIEHRLLFEALAVLVRNRPLLPSEVFGTPAPPAGMPTRFFFSELPSVVVPPEGFPLADFWGTMGDPQAWKPALSLIVTVPVVAEPAQAGPPVTTLTGTYGQRTNGRLASPETLMNIGGRVLVGTPGDPVEGASVRLLDSGALLAEVQTDSDGRFRFDRLQSGSYDLEAGALGIGSDTRTTAVPSPTGDYDLRLS